MIRVSGYPVLMVLAFLSVNLPAQVIISEVMFDPAGPERSDEFVELQNIGATAVDLRDWRIADSSAGDWIIALEQGGTVLAPDQYAVIMDPQYFSDPSTTYNHLLPDSALLLTIDGTTLGSGGFSNSRAETVFLINAGGDTLERYRYSPGNQSGHSDERIEPDGGTQQLNWQDSKTLNGSPGLRNSVTPFDFDLSLITFEPPHQPLQTGMAAHFGIKLINSGRQTADAFAVRLFVDANQDSLAQPEELLASSPPGTQAAGADTLNLQLEFTPVIQGRFSFGIWLDYPADQNLADNYLPLEVIIDSPESNRISINEVMFEPSTGRSEWIELFNAGDQTVRLAGLQIGDDRDTMAIADTSAILVGGGYAVLASDSANVFGNRPPGDFLLLEVPLPSLNNDADRVQLLGPTGLLYQQVPYTANWYGRAVEPGVSLEKLNPVFDGMLRQNWAASVARDGATPGMRNSTFIQQLPLAGRLAAHPNPFSPDDDGRADFTRISYELSNKSSHINLRIFDLRGRLIRFLADNVIVSATGHLVWDGRDENGRMARIGVYICLLESFAAGGGRLQRLTHTVVLVRG